MLQTPCRLAVTTYGSHPWQVSPVEGSRPVGFLWPPGTRREVLEGYTFLQHQRQAGRLTRAEVEAAVAGRLELEVEVVARYCQPATLRQLGLAKLAPTLSREGVVLLGLPEVLELELAALV